MDPSKIAVVKLHGAVADGRHAIVDARDYEAISSYRWYVDRGGTAKSGSHYAESSADRIVAKSYRGKATTVPIGRVVLELHGFLKPGPRFHVDHINFDVFDNRLENLRWLEHELSVGRTRSSQASRPQLELFAR